MQNTKLKEIQNQNNTLYVVKPLKINSKLLTSKKNQKRRKYNEKLF